MKRLLFALSIATAGCHAELVDDDTIVSDVRAERRGDAVVAHVTLRAMSLKQRHTGGGCVRAEWLQGSEVFETAEECSGDLDEDEEVTVVLTGAPVPPPPATVFLRVSMTSGGCGDCYQADANGVWMVRSP